MDAGLPVSLGVEGSYTLSNKVGDYSKGDVVIAASEETAGFYNFNNAARPIPELRARAFATVGVTSGMSVSAYLNHSSSVDDRRTNLPEGVNSVDAFTTVDLHVNYDVNENLAVTVSAINAGDENHLSPTAT